MQRGNHAATFKTLLISFVIVFFVPVTGAVVFYSRIENIMIENARRAHESTLERAKQAVDGYMNEINRLTMQIGFNPELRRYMEQSNYDDPGELYRLISFAKQDHSPRGTRLRVPFFHASSYKHALGSWDGCKRFRQLVVCVMFARQGVKGR